MEASAGGPDVAEYCSAVSRSFGDVTAAARKERHVTKRGSQRLAGDRERRRAILEGDRHLCQAETTVGKVRQDHNHQTMVHAGGYT